MYLSRHVLGKTGHDIVWHQTFWLQDLKKKKSTFSLLFENIKMSHQLIKRQIGCLHTFNRSVHQIWTQCKRFKYKQCVKVT